MYVDVVQGEQVEIARRLDNLSPIFLESCDLVKFTRVKTWERLYTTYIELLLLTITSSINLRARTDKMQLKNARSKDQVFELWF